MNERHFELAQIIWDYHKLKHQLEKSDVILVLCSHDERVAERAVDLFRDNFAPLVIFSGGAGSITRQLWKEPEAERFAKLAVAGGVPAERILIENSSTNTGENVMFTRMLIESLGLDLQKFILVQKPYMERRSYATFRRLWPEKEVLVTSPQVSFDEYLSSYCNGSLSPVDVVSIMVGDLQRIQLYPAKGFQIEQEIPGETMAAYEELVAAGFSKFLIPGE